MDDLTNDKVKELYDVLGISPKSNELNDKSFFNTNEKDEHLAWKSLEVQGVYQCRIFMRLLNESNPQSVISKYINSYSEMTGRNVIVYYSGWLNKLILGLDLALMIWIRMVS